MKQILVAGGGSWGTALAVMLQTHGHVISMWLRDTDAIAAIQQIGENTRYLPGIPVPSEIRMTDQPQVARDVDILLLAVPTGAVRETAKRFAPFLPKGVPVVTVAKGLEQGSLLRPSEILQEMLPHNPVCVLSGPSHAEEVGRGVPTACVVASEDESVARMIQEECMNPTFRLYTNTDLIGVEMGAALKNVIALAAGMSDGLGFGDNTKAALMTRGIAEMARLGTARGGRMETFAGLSGIGDLIVTCTSMHSRNRRAGILLGQGKSLTQTLEEINMVVEGVHTVKAAYTMAQQYGVAMPITEAIHQVLFGGQDAREAVIQLMTRNGKPE